MLLEVFVAAECSL